MHLLSEPVYFPPRVDEDDGLCDGQCLVQVTQRVQLPLLERQQVSVYTNTLHELNWLIEQIHIHEAVLVKPAYFMCFV